jgi:hypothetical protein
VPTIFPFHNPAAELAFKAQLCLVADGAVTWRVDAGRIGQAIRRLELWAIMGEE